MQPGQILKKEGSGPPKSLLSRILCCAARGKPATKQPRLKQDDCWVFHLRSRFVLARSVHLTHIYLCRIKHENIVTLEDIYESTTHFYLVMQL